MADIIGTLNSDGKTAKKCLSGGCKTSTQRNKQTKPLCLNEDKNLLKEKDITHQIRSVLKTFGIFHYKNHGGLGSAPGLPDITGCLKDGRGFWIEVKTDKGRLSPHQERFIQNINDAGGLAFVARSVDDVIEKLDLKKRMLF